MGGIKEDKIEQSKSGSEVGGKIGKYIRFHENNGEIHFHDDDNKLKVAMPVATWFAAWSNLAKNMGEWSYIDAERKTMFSINVFMKKKVQVNVNIKKVEFDNIFEKLQKFTSSN
jgi:hypothetical protein